MRTSPVALPLTRHTIGVVPERGIDGVIDALASLRQAGGRAGTVTNEVLVVVNVVSPSTTQPMLFCRANVEATLASGSTSIGVDLTPAGQYLAFASATLDAASRAGSDCRRTLRQTPVSACGRQLADLRQRLDLVLVLVDGLALQWRDPALAAAGRRLGACVRQLAESARESDAVRCMDDLQYELLPALGAIGAALRR